MALSGGQGGPKEARAIHLHPRRVPVTLIPCSDALLRFLQPKEHDSLLIDPTNLLAKLPFRLTHFTHSCPKALHHQNLAPPKPCTILQHQSTAPNYPPFHLRNEAFFLRMSSLKGSLLIYFVVSLSFLHFTSYTFYFLYN